MKVIEDKFNNNERITCELCSSIFEYDINDIQGLPFGDSYVVCPCCGVRNYLEDEGKKKTIDTLQFPNDFFQFGQSDHAVHLTDEETLETIKNAIHSLRKDDSSKWSCWEAGDTLVLIVKNLEDCEYSINVAKNFYQTEIPFEDIDYEGVE